MAIELAVAVLGVWVIAHLAARAARQTERLENIKAEVKKRAEEEAYVQQILDRVGPMSDTDIRNRLHGIANKK